MTRIGAVHSMRRSHETAICDLVRQFVNEHRGPTTEVAHPDLEKPNEPKQPESVERVWRCPTGLVVVEHTLVESFPHQLAGGTAITQLLVPLRAELEARLPEPGRYYLEIDEGALVGIPRARFADMRRPIVAWVLSEAERLVRQPIQPEESAFAQEAVGRPPGVPFRLILRRWPRRKRAVIFTWSVGPDLESRRSQRVETALRRKAPKLEAAKGTWGAVASLLVLETNDIQLSNVFLVNSAFRRATDAIEAEGKAIPDWVYLVETDVQPFVLWVLSGDGVPISRGPYELRTASD